MEGSGALHALRAVRHLLLQTRRTVSPGLCRYTTGHAMTLRSTVTRTIAEVHGAQHAAHSMAGGSESRPAMQASSARTHAHKVKGVGWRRLCKQSMQVARCASGPTGAASRMFTAAESAL